MECCILLGSGLDFFFFCCDPRRWISTLLSFIQALLLHLSTSRSLDRRIDVSHIADDGLDVDRFGLDDGFNVEIELRF